MEGRFGETLRLLQEAQVTARGLSVAVLVQKNDTAAALADFLRREGRMQAIAESDLRIGADNPFTCAFLALLRAAAHPGDTLAWEHMAMTPARHQHDRQPKQHRQDEHRSFHRPQA